MLIAVLQKLLPKTLEKINSPVNGEICVVEQFGKRKIVVGKLTQSGPVMEEIWKEVMKYLKCHSRESLACRQAGGNPDNKKLNILILGLGGGSIIKVLKKNFSNSKITAVDYDPIMVELGKKYLGLGKTKNLKIIIGDAITYITRHAEFISASVFNKQSFSSNKKRILNQVQNDGVLFDLIFVDLFSGEMIPKKTETEIFLRRIKEKLKENGLVVFNRHYYQNHISEAKIFLDKLKRIFNDVSSKKILTNLLIFARR